MTAAAAPSRPSSSAAAETPAGRRRRMIRDAIIDAAEKVFSQEGVEALSMRRLATMVNYSPAAIYKYFKSKEDLVKEVRELFFTRLLGRVEQAAEAALSGEGSIQNCLRCYIETGLEQPNHYRLAFSLTDEEDVPEEGSMTFEAAMYLENLIAAGVEGGLLRDCDPKVASKSVWAALHGLTSLMTEHCEFPHGLRGSEALTREQIIDFHLDLIERGLRAA